MIIDERRTATENRFSGKGREESSHDPEREVMNIELSTKEYRDLLDILHIADVIFTGHRREEDLRSRQHRALIQKLYSLAQKEGLERLINRNESAKAYLPTAEFEKTSLAHAAIDEFGEHLFWDRLIDRLSARDAAQIAGGPGRLNALNDSDRQALEGPIRQRYVQEFSTNGVASLEVVERLGTAEGTQVRTSD